MIQGPVLVTGGTGFLGAKLVKRLLSDGTEVVVAKRSTSSLARLVALDLGTVPTVDLDRTDLAEVFAGRGFQAVVHSATNYGRSGGALSRLWDDNFLLGAHIAEAAAEAKVPVFLSIGTQLPSDVSAYALSKAQFAEWGRLLRDRIQFVNMRFEHIYGPSDDEKKFLPWVFSQLAGEISTIPLTTGVQQRDFIFIDDVVEAIVRVLGYRAELDSFANFDIGTGQPTAVRGVLEKVTELWPTITGRSVRSELVFGAKAYRPGERMTIEQDLSVIQSLGWAPKYNLDEGLRLSIADYITRMGEA